MDPFRYVDNNEIGTVLHHQAIKKLDSAGSELLVDCDGPMGSAYYENPSSVPSMMNTMGRQANFFFRTLSVPAEESSSNSCVSRSRTNSSSSDFGSLSTSPTSCSPPTFQHFFSPSRASSRAVVQHKPQNRLNGNICKFCFKNGETYQVYKSHKLHCLNDQGEKVVECPVLRKLTCEKCGQTGDFAHTRSHCPLLSNQALPVALMLKSTPRQCNGTLRRRFYD